MLPLTGERKAIELGRERGGRFSPDSRLLAFSSNQSGPFLIYVKDLAESTRNPRSRAGGQSTGVQRSRGRWHLLAARWQGTVLLSQQGGQGVMAVDVWGRAISHRGAEAAVQAADACACTGAAQ